MNERRDVAIAACCIALEVSHGLKLHNTFCTRTAFQVVSNGHVAQERCEQRNLNHIVLDVQTKRFSSAPIFTPKS